jgi:opacity protein-like surface antigen
MKLIKQSKLLTFQLIVSLFFLSTQISFAVEGKKINLKDWQGPYVGLGYADSKLADDHTETYQGVQNGFTGDTSIIKKTPSIFIGHNWVYEKNILSGLEFSIEKRNFFKDDYQKINGVYSSFPTSLKSKGYGYSLKGRVGEIINEQRTLIYVTGGIVQIPIERKFCTTSCYSGSRIDTFKRNERGLILGFGLEHKLQGDISFKFDYEHRDYSTPDFATVNAYGADFLELHDTREDSFKVSLIKSF